MRSRTILLVGFALGLLLVVGAVSLTQLGPYQYQGSLIEPALPAADFSLIRPDGSTFTLSERRGQVVVMFFGYTHCPDICPTTLVEYQNIIAALGEDTAAVDFLFITVDPERDTPDKMGAYVQFFSPHIIGLSAERPVLEAVWKSYGVYQQRQEAGSAAGYLVDHSTRMYVVDQLGNLVLTYPFGFETEKIIQDLQHLVRSGGVQ